MGEIRQIWDKLYIARGTKTWEGPVAPSDGQLHLLFEFTHGITEHFEMAGYLMLARTPGLDPSSRYAGWRIRPRVRLPESWLPVKVSISGEVAFPKREYGENPVTLDIMPIFEKNFGHLQLDVNTTFTRALRGPGKAAGWEFEPAGRAAWELTKRFEPSFEYYGGIGPFRDILPVSAQVHQFYPGFDFKIKESVLWNVGVGFAATPAGNQFVFKTRVGIEFGKKGS